jgi:hypothetical protein
MTGGKTLKIKTTKGDLSYEVAKLRDLWWNAITRIMDR